MRRLIIALAVLGALVALGDAGLGWFFTTHLQVEVRNERAEPARDVVVEFHELPRCGPQDVPPGGSVQCPFVGRGGGTVRYFVGRDDAGGFARLTTDNYVTGGMRRTQTLTLLRRGEVRLDCDVGCPNATRYPRHGPDAGEPAASAASVVRCDAACARPGCFRFAEGESCFRRCSADVECDEGQACVCENPAACSFARFSDRLPAPGTNLCVRLPAVAPPLRSDEGCPPFHTWTGHACVRSCRTDADCDGASCIRETLSGRPSARNTCLNLKRP